MLFCERERRGFALCSSEKEAIVGMLFAFGIFALAGLCVILLFYLFKGFYQRPWTEKAFRFSWMLCLWLYLTGLIAVWTKGFTVLRVGGFYPAIFLAAGLCYLIISVFSDLPDRTKRMLAIVLAVLLVVSGLGLKLYLTHHNAADLTQTGICRGASFPGSSCKL